MAIEVLLLTQEGCELCEQAKAMLARFGHEFPLVVTEEDISTERAQRLAMMGGLLFPPAIVIQGRPFSYGRPSEGRLRRELARLTSQAAGPAAKA